MKKRGGVSECPTKIQLLLGSSCRFDTDRDQNDAVKTSGRPLVALLDSVVAIQLPAASISCAAAVAGSKSGQQVCSSPHCTVEGKGRKAGLWGVSPRTTHVTGHCVLLAVGKSR